MHRVTVTDAAKCQFVVSRKTNLGDHLLRKSEMPQLPVTDTIPDAKIAAKATTQDQFSVGGHCQAEDEPALITFKEPFQFPGIQVIAPQIPCLRAEQNL